MADPAGVLVVAPNWLGDAVMALPAIADVKRAFPSARLTVAARRGVAEVFRLASCVDALVALGWSGRWWQRTLFDRDAAQLRELESELAILLPNSFASAWLVKRAGVANRWGYASDMRAPLLSRAVPRPAGSMHQGAYYQHLTRELGIDSGPLDPVATVPEAVRSSAREFLVDRGWGGSAPLVIFAPGAAYGTAKRWVPRYVADVASRLVRTRNVTCVMVGSRADSATTRQILGSLDAAATEQVIDVAGDTTLEMLAGLLGIAEACVSNDSGAMHLAAAVGTPVIALFGPTNEYETSPLTRHGRQSAVLTHPVWCRPCMLRECPIDHRCMKGITPERVFDMLTRLTSVDAPRGVPGS
jgi:heptosyltransferase-2